MNDGLMTEQLIDKWEKKNFKLSEIADDHTRGVTARLLENEHNWMIQNESTLSTDIAQYKKILMPLTRRIFPNLLANEIVGVQPMNGPVGQAFAMRFYADTTKGNYTKGVTELGYNTVDKDYTGSVPTTASERWGSGTDVNLSDPVQTAEIPRGKMQIAQTTVEAETRMMAAEYNIQAAQDMRAMHGEDLEARMVEFLQYEIQQEIDRELVDRINGLADNNASTYTVSAGDGQWEAEKFRNLYTKIVDEAQAIATGTRAGAGNIIICSSKVVTALDSLGNFMIQPTNSAQMSLSPGIAKVGTIENRFTVYRDSFAATDYATIGYKGPGFDQSGVIYLPYVPLQMARTVREDNPFIPVLAMMSRYGVVDNLINSTEYYRKVNVNFGGSTIA